MQRTKVIPKAV
uniref:Uncharacterized protein n=1 Tax=Anguilla anguilla TaxID=7936 RepID=A0A0E9TGI5_ANGAN